MLLKTASLVVVVWALSAGRDFLLPLFLAGLLSFLMSPAHRFLRHRLRIPNGIAIALSAILLISPLAIVVGLLIRQGQGLVQDFPHMMSAARMKLDGLAHDPIVTKLGLSDQLDVGKMFDKISGALGQGVGIVVGGLMALLGMGSQFFLIFVFAILFLASQDHLRRSGEKIICTHIHCDGPTLIDRSADLIQRFLVARMAIVTIVGVLAALALKVLSLKYSVFLGTFMGLMTLVPAIGSLLAVAVTVIVAFVTGHTIGSVMGIAAALFGISAIENYVLTPKLVGNRLNLNALASFIGLFAGGLLWGVWGMFLSIPTLGVMRIVFNAVPGLRPWGELLSDKVEGEDHHIPPLAHPNGSTPGLTARIRRDPPLRRLGH